MLSCVLHASGCAVLCRAEAMQHASQAKQPGHQLLIWSMHAEVAKRKRDTEERRRLKAAKLAKQQGVAIIVNAGAPPPASASAAAPAAAPAAAKPAPNTPIAFLFPGQGSQAVGMLKVREVLQLPDCCLWLVRPSQQRRMPARLSVLS